MTKPETFKDPELLEKAKLKVSPEGDIIVREQVTVAFRERLQAYLEEFIAKGYLPSEHSLKYLAGRIDQGRIRDLFQVFDAIEHGESYLDGKGNHTKYKNHVSVHFAKDGVILGISPRKTGVRKEWKRI